MLSRLKRKLKHQASPMNRRLKDLEDQDIF